MQLFELSRRFPEQEYTLLSYPMIRSSRSVCIVIATAWRKRRNLDAFVSRLIQAEAATVETQTWIEFAVACAYLHPEVAQEIHAMYDEILTKLKSLIKHAPVWILPS